MSGHPTTKHNARMSHFLMVTFAPALIQMLVQRLPAVKLEPVSHPPQPAINPPVRSLGAGPAKQFAVIVAFRRFAAFAEEGEFHSKLSSSSSARGILRSPLVSQSSPSQLGREQKYAIPGSSTSDSHQAQTIGLTNDGLKYLHICAPDIVLSFVIFF